MRTRRQRGTGSLADEGGVWVARYYAGTRRVHESTGIRVEGEPGSEKWKAARGRAETALRKRLKAAGTPQYVAPEAKRLDFETLADLLRRDHARKGNRAPIEFRIRHLAEAFAGWPALSITTVEVEKYADARRAAGATVATTNRELAALRRAFRLAVRADLLPTMPTVTMASEAGNERVGFLDASDLDGFLNELRARDSVAADCTEFAFMTCLRRSNVLGLTWFMVLAEVENGQVVGGELRLPGTTMKNRKTLTLPLTGRLLALVNRRWQARGTCPWVFHRNGAVVSRFDAAWAAATEAIGRPGLLFHDLRRSGARALRRLGVDELTVMALGSWRTASMFRRYSIVDNTDLREAQAKLDAALANPGAPKVTPLRRPA